MNYDQLASDLIRVIRGPRSQVALSRRLRQRSNVVRSWEAGRRWPTAARFFFVCERAGVDPVAAVRRFYATAPQWLDGADLARPECVVQLLQDLRAGASLADIAQRAGLSRFAAARFVLGKAQPRLPAFLRMVEATSLRLLDFLACFVDPYELPSAAASWGELETARRVSVELPWSHAVLHALELRAYAELAAHDSEFIAAKLGISVEETDRCLRLLAKAKQIRKRRKRWVPAEARTVDTRSNPDAGRSLLAFWADVGRERLAKRKGLFSYNLFTLAERDLPRLRELQVTYFRQLRSIVAQSEPAERVVVANFQLFGLDE